SSSDLQPQMPPDHEVLLRGPVGEELAQPLLGAQRRRRVLVGRDRARRGLEVAGHDQAAPVGGEIGRADPAPPPRADGPLAHAAPAGPRPAWPSAAGCLRASAATCSSTGAGTVRASWPASFSTSGAPLAGSTALVTSAAASAASSRADDCSA